MKKDKRPVGVRMEEFMLSHPRCTIEEIMMGVWGKIIHDKTFRSQLYKFTKRKDIMTRRTSVYTSEKWPVKGSGGPNFPSESHQNSGPIAPIDKGAGM